MPPNINEATVILLYFSNAFVTFANQQDMESARAASRDIPGFSVKNLYMSKKKDGPMSNLGKLPI